MGSYFSPDAILTESEKLPTTLDLTVPNLGHLEGNPGGVLASGTKLNLPLWLAEMLAVSQAAGARPMASLDVPPALGARVLNALKADPRSVDLRAQAMHYYALGARVLELFEEEELADVLAEVGCVLARGAQGADDAGRRSRCARQTLRIMGTMCEGARVRDRNS